MKRDLICSAMKSEHKEAGAGQEAQYTPEKIDEAVLAGRITPKIREAQGHRYPWQTEEEAN